MKAYKAVIYHSDFRTTVKHASIAFPTIEQLVWSRAKIEVSISWNVQLAPKRETRS